MFKDKARRQAEKSDPPCSVRPVLRPTIRRPATSFTIRALATIFALHSAPRHRAETTPSVLFRRLRGNFALALLRHLSPAGRRTGTTPVRTTRRRLTPVLPSSL